MRGNCQLPINEETHGGHGMKAKYLMYLILLFNNILCYGQENFTVAQDNNSNTSLLRLNILKGEKIIQKIEYLYPKEYFENAIYVEEAFEIIDVNFDGFNDILIYLGSYGNQCVVYKDCFLWDVKKQKFENYGLFKDIPNPQIDEAEKYIYGNSRHSSAHYEYEAFVWDENDLKSKFKIHEVYSAMQLAELYNVDIPEDKDSGEYMLEHFDIDSALYDSVFYVKICYDKGKTEISKPAVEIFSDIPERLKKIIK